MKLPSIGVLVLSAAVTAGPVAAQQQPDPATLPTAVDPAPMTPTTPATPPVPSPGMPGGVVATTNNPNLSVASVKLDSGSRVTKVIGAAIYTEQNERVGSVDDLVMTGDDKVTVAIISVGGFLGMGSKLVAVPYEQLRREADRIVLPGATKDSLNAMPSLVY